MAVDRYIHGHHESVLRVHRWRTAENSAGHLLPLLRPGMSLLDVGCGPGTITIDLASRLAPGRVLGVDAAPEVIEQASAAIPEGTTNVDFAVGDAYALDHPDGSFDVVHAHQVLHHLARPSEALREWRRVVAPGGVVAAREVDYAGTIIHPFSDGLVAWAALYQRVHRASGGDPNAGRRLKGWARAAGFRDVEVGASVWVFSSDDDRAWWGGAWADRALESAFAEVARGEGLATRTDLEAISLAWREWSEHPDGWLAMPSGELIARA